MEDQREPAGSADAQVVAINRIRPPALADAPAFNHLDLAGATEEFNARGESSGVFADAEWGGVSEEAGHA